MKNQYKIIALFFLSFLALTVFGQGEKVLDRDLFYKKMQEASANLLSIESDFRQIKHLDVFNENIESKGRFYYKKTALICLEYLEPSYYKIIINEDKIMTYTNGEKNTVTLKSNKIMDELQQMLLASMSGDLSKLTGYKLDVYEGASYYSVHVKPENKSLLAYITGFEIQFNKDFFTVDKLRIRETGENYTDYLFTNQKYNTLSDDEIFTLD